MKSFKKTLYLAQASYVDSSRNYKNDRISYDYLITYVSIANWQIER